MVGDSPISRFVKRLSGVHIKSPKDGHGHGHGHHKKNLMEEKLSNTGNSPSNSSGSEREDGPETISVPSSPQVASKFRGEGGCDINFDSKNFQVIRKLGKGNYGKVLLVHSNGSLFALKEQKMKAGFGQEVDLHLRISQEGDHENIVKLYYASSGRGKTGSIALEYCDGVCVDRLINLLSENEIRFITREILRGIEFLHKIKIMHRDIKPENIMITSTGQIKIIDFGMALMMDKETADQAYGSPLYMAPEMITCIDHPAVYNEKTDIWALGISVIEMAVGVLPHANIEKRNHLVKAVVSEEAPSLSKMMSTKFYSKELQDFVAKSLTKNPEERPSASDLLKHSLFDGVDEGAAAASLGQKVFSKKSPPTNNKNR